jgi:hypothetical protein
MLAHGEPRIALVSQPDRNVKLVVRGLPPSMGDRTVCCSHSRFRRAILPPIGMSAKTSMLAEFSGE